MEQIYCEKTSTHEKWHTESFDFGALESGQWLFCADVVVDFRVESPCVQSVKVKNMLVN